jgi:hypothetical protein
LLLAKNLQPCSPPIVVVGHPFLKPHSELNTPPPSSLLKNINISPCLSPLAYHTPAVDDWYNGNNHQDGSSHNTYDDANQGAS